MKDLPVKRGVVLRAAELVETASRSGGPGGQHVNKASTRVTLRWNLEESDALSAAQRRRVRARLAHRVTRSGEILVHASRHRSRARNRELARERLAELLRDALTVQRQRVATKPGKGSRERRLTQKRQRSEVKRTRRRPPGDD